jgi:hypothetical protein
MFQVHTPIRCWVAAYGFLHRVFGWVVVLRATSQVVCTVRIVHGTIRTVHTISCKSTSNALMMGACTRNTLSYEYINKINKLHHDGIALYFMRKLHGRITLKLPKTCLCLLIWPKHFILLWKPKTRYRSLGLLESTLNQIHTTFQFCTQCFSINFHLLRVL